MGIVNYKNILSVDSDPNLDADIVDGISSTDVVVWDSKLYVFNSSNVSGNKWVEVALSFDVTNGNTTFTVEQLLEFSSADSSVVVNTSTPGIVDLSAVTLWEIQDANSFNLKVPTVTEWEAERVTWSTNNTAGAFASPLKLSSGGSRNGNDGSLTFAGTNGSYWSSTVIESSSSRLNFSNFSATISSNSRAYGYSVRLIVDGTFTQQEFDDNYLGQIFEYQGFSYGFVYNSTTSKIWLDRNLGATQVATSSTDVDSYGDLYQWGRSPEGHQLRTSSLYDGDTLANPTTATESGAWDGNFITESNSPFDWLDPQDDNLWQGVDGLTASFGFVATTLIGKNGLKASYTDLLDLPEFSSADSSVVVDTSTPGIIDLSANTLYTADGTIAASRTVTLGDNTLNLAQNTAFVTRPALRIESTNLGKALELEHNGSSNLESVITAINTTNSPEIGYGIHLVRKRISSLGWNTKKGSGIKISIDNSAGTLKEIANFDTYLTDFTDTLETSEYSISLADAGTLTEVLKLNGSGALQLSGYGTNTITGTPAYNLVTDASGNIIETSLSAGGSTNIYNSDGTIPAATVRNITFGGNNSGINIDRTHVSNVPILNITDIFNSSPVLSINATSSSTSGVVYFITSSDIKVQHLFKNNSGQNNPVQLISARTVDGTSRTVFNSYSFSHSGITGGIGFGGYNEFEGRNGSGALKKIVRYGAEYTDPTNTAEFSAFTVEAMSSGTLTERLRLNGSGALQLSGYGTNTITGTSTRGLGVDATGNVIETEPSGQVINKFSVKSSGEGGIASLDLKVVRNVLVLTAATTQTTSILIPEGAMLYGVQFNVDVAVTTSGASNTFSAAFSGGSTTSLFPIGTSGVLNTKGNKLIVPEVTTGLTDVTFTADNAETFVAGGEIEVLVYYYELTAMANA